MKFRELVLKNRSYRRFDESSQVDYAILESLVDLARLSASGGNRQPLKFLIFNKPGECRKVFPYLAWASYLREWPGPSHGERPSAYIIILGDKNLSDNFGVDHGIAAQSILLGAIELGLGGCMIQSIKRDELRDEISLPDIYEILLVLAIGKPIEEIVIEEASGNEIKYWRDENKVHHVPKRSLKDLIIKI